MREITRMATKFWYTVAAMVVIVAVQWMVLTTVTDWRWRVGALAVPALLAGGTVARLLADHDLVSVRRGGGR